MLNRRLRRLALQGLGSLLGAALGAAVVGVGGFFAYYLVEPPGNCGVVGCWDGVIGALIGAPVGAIAGALLSWRYLSKRLRRPPA